MTPAIQEYEELIALIQARYDSLSRGQQRVASCLMGNLSLVCTGTTLQIAAMAGVSNATVVRFASSLGFSGYAELQGCVRQALVSQRYIKKNPSAALSGRTLADILTAQTDLLKRSYSGISQDDFDRAVCGIAQAERIYVTGTRSTYAPAYFLAGMLNLFLRNTALLTLSDGYAMEELMRAGKNDLFIALTLKRYSRYTYEMVRLAADKGIPVLVVSDSVLSPAGRLAALHLEVRTDSATISDSVLGLMSLAEALISSVAARPRMAPRIRGNLNEFEEWVAPRIFLDPSRLHPENVVALPRAKAGTAEASGGEPENVAPRNAEENRACGKK